MKTAVFQVNDGAGGAHLICVQMPSLRSARAFEIWLRTNMDSTTEIRLLGRFDFVRMTSSPEEAEAVILSRRESGHENIGLTLDDRVTDVWLKTLGQ